MNLSAGFKKVELDLVNKLTKKLHFQIYYTVIPKSHLRWLHPAWHPPSHCPVTLSHMPGVLQLGLQNPSQFTPNNPTGHSVKLFKKYAVEYPSTMGKLIGLNLFLFWKKNSLIFYSFMRRTMLLCTALFNY